MRSTAAGRGRGCYEEMASQITGTVVGGDLCRECGKDRAADTGLSEGAC